MLIQKIGVSLIAILCLILCPTRPALAKNDLAWKEANHGIANSDLFVVAISPDNRGTVYAGASDAIYKTVNGGSDWDEVFSVRGTENTIMSLVMNPMDAKSIYVGTRDGLYRSDDQGGLWKKLFKGIGGQESSVLSVAINLKNEELIFIGTTAGLFRTNDGGSNWERTDNLPSSTKVWSIAISKAIYAATDRGLYQSVDDGRNWKKIFATDNSEGNDEDDYSSSTLDEDEEIANADAELTVVSVDPTNHNTVYIGTSKGVFISRDSGAAWNMISSAGLTGRGIRHIAISPAEDGALYVATGNGVFRYSRASGRWMELYKGLTSTDIRHLAFDALEHKTLWAATKDGMFKTVPTIQNSDGKGEAMEVDNVTSLFAHEPTIIEMQEAAIRYAEVHPEKIEGWRKAAERKAWLPDLRVGYDQSKDWQSGTYFYSTSTVKYKDDDITRGRDSGWSVSLTWELGDLIWNNDQTSIDTRSRLMVQLRDDVLNEVTRLYFERRRLQIDLHLSPPEEAMETLEKELRLQELTAKIDALTGFVLSRRLGLVK